MWKEVAASWHQSILLLLSKHKTKKKGNHWNHSTTDKAKMPKYLKHAVPEIIQTSSTDGIRFSWGIIEMYQAKLEFSDGWVALKKIPTVVEVSLVIFWNYAIQTVAL